MIGRCRALFESFVELTDGLLGVLTLGNVDQHVDGADQRTRTVVQRRRVRQQVAACAVGPLRDDLDAPDRPVFPQRDSHRALVMGQRRAVRTAQTPVDAPQIAAQLRPLTGELDRGLVKEGDPPGSIGRIDRRRQGFEKLTPCLGSRRGAVERVTDGRRGHLDFFPGRGSSDDERARLSPRRMRLVAPV